MLDAGEIMVPKQFADFRNYHAGETILVCGCGSSLSQIVSPERFVTIGVNDVGRLFTPDYLVVLNPGEQFRGGRFQYVEKSKADAVFTQLDLELSHPNVVRLKLGKFGGVDESDSASLPYTRNSPYLAVCLAVHMGASRIGLIGVDFTEHHFFAPTGTHPLAGRFSKIDQEYTRLYEHCRSRGIEVFNLSHESRLTALPKMSPEDFSRLAVMPQCGAWPSSSKVFFVNYRFLSCGDVFRDGLIRAARDLRVNHDEAYWDDPDLPDKVKEFSPDLLFVVHGRKFFQKWRHAFGNIRSAVWLLDEPYEVDDTSDFSKAFTTTFVNDPATIDRHRNAHYLPVCCDPERYWYRPAASRDHAIGFIGGYNAVRQELLDELARRKLLSYVVGGPWRTPALRSLTLSANTTPDETAELYRQTKIVLNVFRSVHHFNSRDVFATSMNPRIYEATACGALVVSEPRSEIVSVCPGLPTFEAPAQLVPLLERLLDDPDYYDRVRRSCVRELSRHTYADRLQKVLRTTLQHSEVRPMPVPQDRFLQDWTLSTIVRVDSEGLLTARKKPDVSAGTEQGLVGNSEHSNVVLSFDLFLEPGASFLAKIHLQNPQDQSSNSYHLYTDEHRSYFARHHHVFRSLNVEPMRWTSIRIAYYEGFVAVRINGDFACAVRDRRLTGGFCFLGIKGGTARLRNIQVSESTWQDVGTQPPIMPPHTVLYRNSRVDRPVVSIVTTVYDRLQCLERCLRSVNQLHYPHTEQIVVADAPPAALAQQLRNLTEVHDSGINKRVFATLENRANDWGIAPAAVGLSLAEGKYICFLSDDNCYLPDHLGPLVATLEAESHLGFVYSSCLYDGRLTLRSAPPQPGRIDLGQPVFRKELFEVYFNGTLPFREHAWDWRMIEHLLRHGIRWKHLNRPTFVFRSDKYPHIVGTAR